MMNDSVREELKDKISAAPRPTKIEAKPNPPIAPPKISLPVATVKPELPPIETAPKPPVVLKQPVAVAATPAAVAATPAAVAVKTHTSEITAKPTSPTLVEFQNKNAALPDWRLQLQNAVRKRVEHGQPVSTAETQPVVVSRINLPTNGGAALKAEIIEEPAPVADGNPKLANALKRIEESRRRFLPDEPKEETAPPLPPTSQNKNYPFYIATKNAEVLPKPAEVAAAPAPAAAPAKPKLEDLPVIEKKPYDTNKLKPLPNASVIAANLEKVSGELPKIEVEEKIIDAPLIKISRVVEDETGEAAELEEIEFAGETEEQEGEDLAPFAMRFNSAVFDLIIGAFTSLILLAPFMLTKGSWLSMTGILAFLATCAIVMFVYLTTSIGMFGKTAGMKIFSLEAIDIEENDYPTFHQAAVSSSVYLVSLALGGIGFIPALFNSERRTAPDLLSGTVIVKEY